MMSSSIYQIAKKYQILQKSGTTERFFIYSFFLPLKYQISIISKMKNSLQLQITATIKKANQHFTKSEFSQSVALYDRALDVYRENRSYNSFVSTHFEAVIYSLKGLSHFALKQYEISENMLNQSLKINPHDSLTLIRRANLYLQTNRLSQSIQDTQKAYIYDPQGKSLQALVNSLKNSLQQLEDENQKTRLTENLSSITRSFQIADTIQLDQQEALSFCNLKKIDRASFTSSNQKCGKPSLYQTQFLNQNVDRNNKKQTESQCLESSNQDENLPVSIIQKSKSKKTKGFQRSQWKCLSINLCQQNEVNNKLIANGDSIKSIDHKLERRTSVKFLQNPNITGSQKISQIQSIQKQSPKQRKSCLRSSKICATQEQTKQQKNTHRRTSSFMQLKNIQGSFIPSSINNIHEGKQSSGLKEQSNENTNQKEMSDSDQEEGREHNIFGDKYGTGKILKCLQNLGNWSGKNIEKDRKKGSILKKNSVIGSQIQAKTSGKLEQKKSVCFLQEN